MLKKLILLLLTASIFSASLAFASENNNPKLKQANSVFEEASQTFDLTQLEEARQLYLELYQSSNHDYLTAYKIAHVDSKLVEYYQNKDDKKMMAFYIRDALKYVDESISMNDRFSDAYCLFAGMIGRKIGLEGIASGIINRKKSADALKRAMELDPANPDVYVGQGITFIATPQFFGGDLNKGIEYLNQALEMDPGKYRAYVWLSKAYRRKGDLEKARDMILKALSHNPNDASAKLELTRLPHYSSDVSVR